MQHVTNVIDTLYEAMMRLSLEGFSYIHRAYTGHNQSIEREVTDTPSESQVSPTVETHDRPSTFRKLEDILTDAAPTIADTEKHVVMYAQRITVPVYKNPTVEFDGKIMTLPYGEMVMMLEPKGRFLRVSANGIEGWVLKEDLVDRAAYVYPDFTIGEENLIDSPNTARVRALIGDAFDLTQSEFALQAGEYVLYRLLRNGIKIQWPPIRPRIPGSWHKILRGLPGVHVSVTPKRGALMEYTYAEVIGHLAYVEAVFPEDTITISEANYPDSGIYNERTLTREEWKELRPVFITIR